TPDLVFAHQGTVTRHRDAVAFVREQDMFGPDLGAAIGRMPAGEGGAEISHAGAAQVDDPRLSRADRFTAAPVDEDPALGPLDVLRHIARFPFSNAGRLWLGWHERQAFAHAHSGRDDLSSLDARIEAVVEGDVQHPGRHDAHAARHAVRGSAARPGPSTHHARHHPTHAGGHFDFRHAGHAAGGHIEPELRLGRLDILRMGACRTQAKPQGEQRRCGGADYGTRCMHDDSRKLGFNRNPNQSRDTWTRGRWACWARTQQPPNMTIIIFSVRLLSWTHRAAAKNLASNVLWTPP